MNYWKVKAKCGHVGKTKYITKFFYVKAETKKEAAEKVRWFPRVKHHHKDAIKEVKCISQDEFVAGLKEFSKDPYFKAKNKQEQKAKCVGIDYETFYEERHQTYKKNNHLKRSLIDEQRIAEWKKQRSNESYE